MMSSGALYHNVVCSWSFARQSGDLGKEASVDLCWRLDVLVRRLRPKSHRLDRYLAGDDPSGEDTYCASHCEKSRSWKVLGPDVEGSDEYASSGVATSLSEDGSILAIGSSRASDDAEPGYVRVYRRTTVDEDSCLALGCVTEGVGARDEWIQLGDEVVGEGAGDAFGGAVQLSSDGSRLVVGAAGNDGDGTVSDAGHARVFAYDETNAAWTQLGGDLVGDEPGERAGAAVAISGDGARVAVGATYANNSGRVRVYEYVAADDAWNQIGEDIAGSSPNSTLGASVALSRNGSVVAVGGRLNDGNGSNSGHVRVYQPASVVCGDGSGFRPKGPEAGSCSAVLAFGVSR